MCIRQLKMTIKYSANSSDMRKFIETSALLSVLQLIPSHVPVTIECGENFGTGMST
ncbi:MAG: hypothetical protein ACI90V_001528 [Bacillariaceae sp.]|jgi:hypothetical protein